MDKKFLSSSSSGHIILSKLADSVYKIYFGFPKNEWPGQNVTISVKETDAGFVLKNFGEKGWGLLNLQTMLVLMAENKDNTKRIVETDTTGNEFAKILASVVNDPAIAQITRIQNDSTSLNNSGDKKIESKTADSELVKTVMADQGKADSAFNKGEILKIMYVNSDDGINISYLDKVNDAVDTIKLFIPVTKSAVNSKNLKQLESPNTGRLKDGKAKKDSRFIDMELPNPNIKRDSGFTKTDVIDMSEKRTESDKLINPYQDSTVNNLNTREIIQNANCKRKATENEYLKLKKQMSEGENANNMTRAANKFFISTCFTTDQIKNLGVLFIKEEERYKFFVAAFPYVLDTNNFASLEDQLSDDYYITRFKAMLRH